MKRILVCSVLFACSAMVMADEIKPMTQVAEIPTEIIQPFSKAEIQQGMQEMQQRLNTRIEDWGGELKREDFEWTWRGRQLKQYKRTEVCGIFQGVVNEIYSMAQKNRARLSVQEQALLKDRSKFIEALGYQHNRVDTKMGFDCLLK